MTWLTNIKKNQKGANIKIPKEKLPLIRYLNKEKKNVYSEELKMMFQRPRRANRKWSKRIDLLRKYRASQTSLQVKMNTTWAQDRSQFSYAKT